MPILQRTAALGITGSAVAALLLGTASQAQADTGVRCDWGSYCMAFYYNSDLKGSYTYFIKREYASLDGIKFLGEGAGKGQSVKNNAASAWNGTQWKMQVYFNSNWTGPCDSIPSYKYAPRLNYTYNDNASFAYGRSDAHCWMF
ncbi:peptidase inhibitor family I36 protein [Streptomyces sp. NPDC091377]|uniref:peptidase inhibitor family I36 protein n=1 Tax=Streptomyces sp. NPDC091377 TaxID=3365995 RepID=UPI00381B78EA